MKHKYKNSDRPGDVKVEYLSKDEIIEILYKRLRESDKIIQKIKELVTSSFGVKDISDYNNEILNPLYSTFEKTNYDS